jgi:hypothetical protein
MCFSAPVSIASFAVGAIGSARLYTMRYVPEAAFYFVVVLMQLVEFFLWRLQDCADPRVARLNDMWTTIGTVVNHLEPVVLWTAVAWASCNRLPPWVHAYMVAFVACSIAYTMSSIGAARCTTVTDRSKPHLEWHWNSHVGHAWYYAMFVMALVLVSVYGLDHGVRHAIVVCVSFASSFLVYQRSKSVGAMWCFFAAFIPWALPIVYGRDKK